MQRTLISETTQKVGESVRVCGWVNIRRDHGKIIFIDLRDRGGILQCVITPGTKNYESAKSIRAQYAVDFKGKIKKRPENLINPRMETGKVEMEVLESEILSEAQSLPVDVALPDMNLHIETLLDNRNLTIRNEKVAAIFKVFGAVIEAYSDFLRSLGFLEIKTPKLLSACTEGGAEFFKVEYFEKEAFLAQSPQFYKQAAVGAFERVFEINPVFRAERHFTSRHVNEFTGLDAEMGFIKSSDDVMDVLEETMRHIAGKVKENCQTELALHDSELEIPPRFPRVKFSEAIEILKNNFGKNMDGNDIDPEGERMLGEWAFREKKSDFIFITNYPWTIRPMYIMPDPKNPKETFGFDLLYRGVEISSGGQRIHKYEQLVENMKRKNLNPEDFRHYLEIFRYGMPPHGGWGLGAERIVQKMLGLKSIKEAILFPRDVKRLTP